MTSTTCTEFMRTKQTGSITHPMLRRLAAYKVPVSLPGIAGLDTITYFGPLSLRLVDNCVPKDERPMRCAVRQSAPRQAPSTTRPSTSLNWGQSELKSVGFRYRDIHAKPKMDAPQTRQGRKVVRNRGYMPTPRREITDQELDELIQEFVAADPAMPHKQCQTASFTKSGTAEVVRAQGLFSITHKFDQRQLDQLTATADRTSITHKFDQRQLDQLAARADRTAPAIEELFTSTSGGFSKMGDAAAQMGKLLPVVVTAALAMHAFPDHKRCIGTVGAAIALMQTRLPRDMFLFLSRLIEDEGTIRAQSLSEHANGVGVLISGALAWIMCGGRRNVVERVAMCFNTLPRVDLGMNKVKDVILDILQWVVNRLRAVCGKEAVQFRKAICDDLKDWTSGVACLNLMSIKGEVHENSYSAMQLMYRLHSKGAELSRRRWEHPSDASIFRLHNTLLEKLLNQHGALLKKMAGLRVEPFVLFLSGDSGVGKSWCTTQLACDALTRILPREELTRALNEGGVDKHELFTRTIENNYWDGYVGQKGVVIDDWGQASSAPGIPSDELELIRVANVWQYHLHMASIEAKSSCFFVSEFIICTSNQKNADNAENLRDKDAVNRRLGHAYTVRPKPEFAMRTETGLRMDYEKVHAFKQTLPEEQRLTFMDFWEFQRYDTSSAARTHGFGPTEGPIGYDEILRRMVDGIAINKAKHQETASIREARLRRYIETVQGQSLTDAGTQTPGQASQFAIMTEPATYNVVCELLGFAYHAVTMFPRSDRKFSGCLIYGPDLYNEQLARDLWRNRAANARTLREARLMLALNRELLRQEFLAGRLQYDVDFVLSKLDARLAKRFNLVGQLERYTDACNGWFKEVEHMYGELPEWVQVLLCGALAGVAYGILCAVIVGIVKAVVPDSKACDHHLSKRNKKHLKNFIRGITDDDFQEFDQLQADGSFKRVVVPMAFKPEHDPSTYVPVQRAEEVDWDKSGVAANSGVPRARAVNPIIVRPNGSNEVMYDYDKKGLLSRQAMVQEVEKPCDTVAANCCRIEVPHKGGGAFAVLGSGLFIGGPWVLVPKHYTFRLKLLMAQGKINESSPVICVVDANKFKPVTVAKFIASRERKYDSMPADSDIMAVECEPGTFTPRNVTNHFVNANAAMNLSEFRARLHTIRRNPTGVTSVIMYGKAVCDDSVKTGLWGNDGAQETYKVRCSYRYDIPGVDGYCGSPVFNVNSYHPGGGRCIGVHVAGIDGKCGFAALITRELAEEITSTVRGQSAKDLIEADDTSFRFVEYCKTAPMPKHSSLAPSPIAEHIQNDEVYVKAPLAPFVGKDGHMIDPMEVAIQPYGEPHFTHDAELAEACAYDWFRCAMNSSQHGWIPTVYGFEEASAGRPGDPYFNGLPRSNACGYPWCLNGGTDKKKFFGKEGPYEFGSRWCEQLRSRVQKDINLAARGIRTEHIFTDLPKDEKRKLAKAERGATRLISGCPVEYAVEYRMFFMDFHRWVMCNCIENGICVGMNVFSEHWTRLSKLLRSKGDRVVAGDFTGYDTKQCPVIQKAILRIINRWFGDDNAQTREVLWRDLYNSRHVLRDVKYDWNHSMPSGHPGTSIINSIYNQVLFRMCWCKEFGLARLPEFSHHVYLAVFGDDNVLNITDAASERFNQHTITAHMRDLGMTYTSEDKDSDVAAWRSLEEVSFLKRKFLLEDGRYLAALSKTSIREMVRWTRLTPGADAMTIFRTNIEVSLTEAAAWGEEFWREWYEEIVRSLRMEQVGYQPELGSRTGYLIKFVGLATELAP